MQIRGLGVVLESHLEQGDCVERLTAFDKALGSLESRVLPQVRRFKELGATTEEDIPRVEPLDHVPRSLTAPELADESNESETTPDER